jgi:hypothetical protein
MKLFLILPAVAFLAGCAHHYEETVATSESPKQNDSPYTTPLSTPGARFGLLPQVVQNTVRSEAGTAEIIDVKRQVTDDKLYYKISFLNYVNFPPLLVGVDGSVLNSDLSVAIPAPQEPSLEVKLTEVPPVVKKVIQEKQLVSLISSIHLENWGNHTVYVFTYKDEGQQQPQKMYVVADGTLLVPARQN